MAITKVEAKLLIKVSSADDVRELQECLNARTLVLDGEACQSLKRGDPVWFDAGRRGLITGHVRGFKRGGKVEVQQLNSVMKWTCPGRMLKRPQAGTSW
jgi:hypothetical protein